jgi:hypothetical protein
MFQFFSFLKTSHTQIIVFDSQREKERDMLKTLAICVVTGNKPDKMQFAH